MPNEKVLGGLLFVLVLLGALNFAWASTQLLPYEYDLDYSEGFALEDGQRLLTDQAFYPDPEMENGFESVKYPPVYYVLLAALSQLSGMTFLTGRFLNLAATVASLGAIYLIARRETGKKKLYIPLVFLAPYLTIFTGLTIRVDMLALAFSLAGVYLFIQDKHLFSAPFFILAFFTKQSFVAGFLACSVYLFSQVDWRNYLEKLRSVDDLKQFIHEERDFIVFNSAYGFPVLLVFGFLALLSPHFIQNIFSANVGGFSVRWDLLNWIHLTFLPVFGLTVYYLYIFRDRLMAAYFTISVVIMLVQLMRGGAWVYSVIQPFAISVICITLLYERAGPVRKYVSVILILQLLVFFQAPFASGNILDVSSMPEVNREADDRLSGYIEGAEGPVYSELAGFEIAEGREPSPEIWGVYEQYSSGKVNNTQIQNFFRDNNYSVIIAHKRLYRLPLENYTVENYDMVDKIVRNDMLMHEQHWQVYKWTG